MTTLTQFTVFPKLSNDLKAMIWDIASQEPRRIQFGYYVVSKRKDVKKKNNEPISERDKIFSGKRPDYPYPWRLSATGRVPSVLITCRESRHWAMKHYRLDFKDQLYSKAMCGENIHGFVHFNTSLRNCRGDCKNFPNLRSLVTRTNGVDTEDVSYHSSGVVTGANNISPFLKVGMNQLWNSDEWEAIRIYGQIPELRTFTRDELCSDLILPFGPSNIIKRQQRSSKADASLVLPACRSEHVKSMKTRLDVED